MAQTEAIPHSPNTTMPKRPKGILKNSNSFQGHSPDLRTSPTTDVPMPLTSNPSSEHAILASPVISTQASRPGMPEREMSEKEIVQMNTELNAGGHRRNSSNARASFSRRTSAHGSNGEEQIHDESGMRLKWDEANLYVNESQMGGRMKIDEPKTPFVRNADPAADDDEEVASIDTSQVNVDELDMGMSSAELRSKKEGGPRDNDIPGLDIGEPELDAEIQRRDSDGEKKVIVDQDSMDIDDGKHDPETDSMTSAEKVKHQRFEQMRKKHYEMKNVKNLLGHSDDLDD
ncbi:hypothetical protein K431DRAFT_323091 [Polychaeton citri CBS 116435]|uniref:Glc8 protein n=1 Tax=Polychaeton citri CBS 116435 TaxID=1314669 RepID=A0A9P4Q0J2_9PEZI|nr:hypothetical protein K431DRAFT_323091 [Polychaeton citri CBS 116435]